MQRKQQLELNEELNSNLKLIDILETIVHFEGTSSPSVRTSKSSTNLHLHICIYCLSHYFQNFSKLDTIRWLIAATVQ